MKRRGPGLFAVTVVAATRKKLAPIRHSLVLSRKKRGGRGDKSLGLRFRSFESNSLNDRDASLLFSLAGEIIGTLLAPTT